MATPFKSPTFRVTDPTTGDRHTMWPGNVGIMTRIGPKHDWGGGLLNPSHDLPLDNKQYNAQYEHITCPVCRKYARMGGNPAYSKVCTHTQDEKDAEDKRRADFERTLPPTLTNFQTQLGMGGTKKKSRRLRRRKSKSKIQRRGKSVKRRRQ